MSDQLCDNSGSTYQTADRGDTMKKLLQSCIILLALGLAAHPAGAGMIKAYFAGFAVSGTPDRDEVRGGLQSLLASHLTSAAIFSVDSPTEADLTISGSYVVFGSVFGVEAVAKNSTGGLVARVLVQGAGKDELIPAVERLAKELAVDVRKVWPSVSAAPSATAGAQNH